jgi:uncharacterized protein YbjT (DUF2867 family)
VFNDVLHPGGGEWYHRRKHARGGSMILIVGATGLVGSATVRQLTTRGVPVRALVRSAEKAATLAGPDVETVVGDLEQPSSLDAALDGVTRALLISPLNPRQVEWQGNFVEAARRAGTVHIVKLSGLGTALDSPLRSGRWHAQTERHIADAGLPWTHLHPPFFMQNLLRSATAIATQGVLAASMQAGKIAMVDARDVAAVAVAALTSDGHAGKTYTITGPEALSFHEVAQKLSDTTGRRVTYQDVPLATVWQELVATGIPAWLVEVRMEFATALRDGYAAAVTDTVQAVTGQPPRTFDTFVHEYAALFGGA